MGLNSRQKMILASLGGGAYVEVKDLATELSVDVSTIRRDLQILTSEGFVERLHGGVRLQGLGRPDVAAIARSHTAIASTVRRMLRGNERIMLGSGPTIDHLVPLLFDLPNITVITNDLRTADILAQHASITVLAAGGELRDAPARATTSGPHTAAYIESLQADWSFIEVQGIHPFSGLTISTPWSVTTQRALLSSAQRKCVLAPSNVFGIRCVGFVSPTNNADLIITDEELADEDLPPFQGRVLRTALDADSYTSR